jgi:hypothetical protein
MAPLSRSAVITLSCPRAAAAINGVLPLQAALLWTLGAHPTRVEQQAHDFHVLGHLVHCMVQCRVAVRVSPVDAPLRTTIQEPTNASGVSFCRGVH